MLMELLRLYAPSSSALPQQASAAAGAAAVDAASSQRTLNTALAELIAALDPVCRTSLDLHAADSVLLTELTVLLLDIARVLLSLPSSPSTAKLPAAFDPCASTATLRLLHAPTGLTTTLALLFVAQEELNNQAYSALAAGRAFVALDDDGAQRARTILPAVLQRLRPLAAQSTLLGALAHDDIAEEEAELQRALWQLAACNLLSMITSLQTQMPSASADGSSVALPLLNSAVSKLAVLFSYVDSGNGALHSFPRRCALQSASALAQLLSEEDDVLVGTLTQLALVHAALAKQTELLAGSNSSASAAAAASDSQSSLCSFATAFRALLPPYALLHSLLSLLAFDHTALLDLLLGDETSALQFLLTVVKLVADEDEELQQLHARCCERHVTATDTAQSAAAAAAAGYNDNERMDAGEGENAEEKPLDSSQDVLDCLIRLRLALERLSAKGLFPYDCAPLIRQLQRLESRAESADFDDEELSSSRDDDGSSGDEQHACADSDAV
jgi:hypothetical protein